MIPARHTQTSTPQAYPSGQPYSPARGRYAPRTRVADYMQTSASVVQGRPDADEFVRLIVREMRIRFYQPKTVKPYRSHLVSLLRWFGAPAHRLTREDVREYLLYLVDGGASSSMVSNHLSAIRTAFDKFCLRQVTLGLVTPRKPKRLPVILSPEEIMALLQAAPSLRDKLLLGLMYATGMRVSEVVRVRWRDLDFDRRLINVWQCNGRTDRQVTLPNCFESLLRTFYRDHGEGGAPWLCNTRHSATGTLGRALELAISPATRPLRGRGILRDAPTRDLSAVMPASSRFENTTANMTRCVFDNSIDTVDHIATEIEARAHR